MKNMVEEFSPTKAIPRSGFLTGAAAQRMKNFMRNRSAENLQRVGFRLAEEPTRVASNPMGAISKTASDPHAGFHWDTFTVGVSSAVNAPITLFQTPQSQQAKQLAATSLRDPGSLGAQESMIVTGMRFFFLNNLVVSDLLAFYSSVSVQLFLGPSQFPIWQGLPWMVPAGGGAYISGGNQVGTPPGAASVLFSLSNGLPSIEDSYMLSDPIELDPLEKFNVVLTPWGGGFTTSANTTNPPGTGVTGVFALEGEITQRVSVITSN